MRGEVLCLLRALAGEVGVGMNLVRPVLVAELSVLVEEREELFL